MFWRKNIVKIVEAILAGALPFYGYIICWEEQEGWLNNELRHIYAIYIRKYYM